MDPVALVVAVVAGLGAVVAGLGAVVAGLGAVVAGTVAHELSHAFVLRAGGIPCDVEWLPDRDDAGVLAAGLRGRWATVTPRTVTDDVAPWRLRAAAVAPVPLAGPFLLVPAGVLPDPFSTGSVHLQAAAVGWLAPAVPSPGDFSLLWYADRAIGRDPESSRAGTAE